MNKTITLTLNKPLIIESVKNETYQTGKFERAANPGSSSAAFVEQAGNEDYHERILLRSLSTGLEDLKTHLSDYLSSNGASSGDNIGSTISGDNITITLVVGDRFNSGFTNSLAKLCSKYIEETMLMDWWRPVNKDRASLYAEFVERDLKSIRRCFNKTAPTAPSYQYPVSISVEGSSIELGVGEESTVTYTLSAGAIDDIEARIERPQFVETGRTEEGFTIKGKSLGHSIVTLYSRHNPSVSVSVEVFVTAQS